jgi:hypothetical protein
MVRVSGSFVARAAPAALPDGDIRECGAAVDYAPFGAPPPLLGSMIRFRDHALEAKAFVPFVEQTSGREQKAQRENGILFFRPRDSGEADHAKAWWRGPLTRRSAFVESVSSRPRPPPLTPPRHSLRERGEEKWRVPQFVHAAVVVSRLAGATGREDRHMRTLTGYGIGVVIVFAVLNGIAWQAGMAKLHSLNVFSAGFVIGMLGTSLAAFLYGYRRVA